MAITDRPPKKFLSLEAISNERDLIWKRPPSAVSGAEIPKIRGENFGAENSNKPMARAFRKNWPMRTKYNGLTDGVREEIRIGDAWELNGKVSGDTITNVDVLRFRHYDPSGSVYQFWVSGTC